MKLIDELQQQPESLRCLVDFYQKNIDLVDLSKQFPGRRLALTGMGASFHAAWISSFYMNYLGIPCAAMEAADLLNYGLRALEADTLMVCLSQSGSSGEVTALLEKLNTGAPLVGITNHLDSPLASRAQWVLPMVAGEESLIASKTYLNTLAVLWLVARRRARVFDGSEFASLMDVAGRIAAQFQHVGSLRSRLMTTFEGCQPLLLLGHGPHGVTARQAAMILSEWAKVPTLHYGIGAFRHGYIEIVEPGSGAVVFAPPGQGAESARALARDLQNHGAHVLLVENGLLRELDDPTSAAEPLDEFLSPMVDIVPFQIYTDALALQRGFGNGFRYISKVVTGL